MNTYVSMLRGINVGKNKRVRMQNLAELYLSMGLQARIYGQSGNVIFEHAGENIPKLTSEIEKQLKSHLGFEVRIFIRTQNELRKLIEQNPFVNKDENRLHVTFLYRKLTHFPVEELNKARGKGEEFSTSPFGKEVYLFCPNGYGRTKLSNAFFERTLNVSATTRNWRTTKTLSSMA